MTVAIVEPAHHDGRQRLMDGLFSISLPSFLLIRSTDSIIFVNDNKRYFTSEENIYVFLAFLINFLLIGMICYSLARLYHNKSSPALRYFFQTLFIVSFIVPAAFARDAFELRLSYVQGTAQWMGLSVLEFAAVIVVPVAAILAILLTTIARTLYVIVVVLFPFGCLAILQAIIGLGNAVHASPATPSPATQSGLSREHAARGRVILLVFDGLDNHVLFGDRPDGWRYPAFDQLKRVSVYGSHARGASTNTLRAIPGLLIGQTVSHAAIDPRPDLLVSTSDGSGSRYLSSVTTLFHRLHASGHRVVVFGWYHPYCRLFRSLLTRCRRFTLGSSGLYPPSGIFRALIWQLRAMSILHKRYDSIEAYREILDEMVAAVRDKNSDFVYIHAHIPHDPFIYDAAAARITSLNFRPTAYLDNVALADRFLGRLVRELKVRGEWERTSLIVTSDHGAPDAKYKFETEREAVPFLVRLPGQAMGVILDEPFNAVVVADLAVTLAERGLSMEPDDVIAWLRQRRLSR